MTTSSRLLRILHALRLGSATAEQIAQRLAIPLDVASWSLDHLRRRGVVQVVGHTDATRPRRRYGIVLVERARQVRDERVEDEILRLVARGIASPRELEQRIVADPDEIRDALGRLRAWGHLRIRVRWGHVRAEQAGEAA